MSKNLMEPWVDGHSDWTRLVEWTWAMAGTRSRETAGIRHLDTGWDAMKNWQWVWDTCFVSLFARYGARELPAMGGIDGFYRLQREDGFIGMAYDWDRGAELWPGRINPPLFLWAEREYVRTTGDLSRLERVLEPNRRFLEWIEAHRQTPPHRRMRATDGEDAGLGESEDNYSLYWFEDAGSAGMDDSPRTPRHPEAGRFYDWVDLSAQMALAYRVGSELAQLAGQDHLATGWRTRHEAIINLIHTELWCARSEFFHDRLIPANFVSAKTIAGFWPLLAGDLPVPIVDQLVGHLSNPATFGTPTPVASLSRDDPNYDGDTYWRGSVWAPTNYMVLRGLALQGRRDVAHNLAIRYLEALAKIHHHIAPPSLWESISAERHQPGLQPYIGGRVRKDFVGWSGLGPTSIFLEHIIGIEADAEKNTLHWDLRLAAAHGVRNLHLGSLGNVELAITSSAEPTSRSVTAFAEKSCNLRISSGTHTWNFDLPPGKSITFNLAMPGCVQSDSAIHA